MHIPRQHSSHRHSSIHINAYTRTRTHTPPPVSMALHTWPSHTGTAALTSRSRLAASCHGAWHYFWLLLELVIAISAPFASDRSLHTHRHMHKLLATNCKRLHMHTGTTIGQSTATAADYRDLQLSVVGSTELLPPQASWDVFATIQWNTPTPARTTICVSSPLAVDHCRFAAIRKCTVRVSQIEGTARRLRTPSVASIALSKYTDTWRSGATQCALADPVEVAPHKTQTMPSAGSAGLTRAWHVGHVFRTIAIWRCSFTCIHHKTYTGHSHARTHEHPHSR